MAEIELRGVKVCFPFEPYDIQKNYMEKVIECLQTETNGVLESPTGTGKTLSLLCSSLAWLSKQKAELKFPEPSVLINRNKNPEQPVIESRVIWDIPTIIYASRTHSQLNQAMQELKRTKYSHFKATVIGSRDQMCIHPDVMNQTTNAVKITMCQQMVKAKNCYLQNRVEKMASNPTILEKPIADIEDLIELGKKHKFCPYYMTRELKKHADIIFMPYNYLLDPRARRANNLELRNCVIILDEAHNVEKVCEDSASIQLKSTDIALCIEEVTDIMKKHEEGYSLGLEDTEKDFSMEDLVMLKTILLKLEEALDKIPIPRNNEGVTFEGKYIFEIFKNGGIDDQNHTHVVGLIENLTIFLSTVSKENPFQRSGVGIQLLQDLLLIIFHDITSEFKERVNKCFKVHLAIEEEKGKKKTADTWLSKASTSTKSSCRVLSYWCFSPNFGMRMLLEKGVRCVILTSGTLAPLKPLISELGINVGVRLENPHVVDNNQICVKILSAGPDGTILNSSFQNRDNQKYIHSLGLTIVNISRQIPHGLLIFFPSYAMLYKCQESWQHSNIWTSMNDMKTVFVEPKTKDAFTSVMQDFYSRVKSPDHKGAIFMAVCRGKVSEGLDFADMNGRGVIITGLPYPPFKDPRVELKRRYLDACRSQNSEYISGQEWYGLEATRAVNQAIGRVIRHRNDYGAILLLDNRFNSAHVKNQLSLWVREHVQLAANFKVLIRDMRLFFKNADEIITVRMDKDKNTINDSIAGEVKIYDKNIIKLNTLFSDSAGSSKENDGAIEMKDKNKRSQNQLLNQLKRRKILIKPIDYNNEDLEKEEEKRQNTQYLAMLQTNLDKPIYNLFVETMINYNREKNFDDLINSLNTIFKPRPHLRFLIQGFTQYVKDHHKEKFFKYWEEMR